MPFDWDDENLKHIAIHHVTPAEAEQAMGAPNFVSTDAYHKGEWRDAIIGMTAEARLLCVVFTERDERLRVVTAYKARRDQMREYFRR